MNVMDTGSITLSWMLPCSVAPVVLGRGAVCRPGICTTLRPTCPRSSGRAFLANRLLLRKQQGEERRGFTPSAKGGSEGLPSECLDLERISTIMETEREDDTKQVFRGRISDMIIR